MIMLPIRTTQMKGLLTSTEKMPTKPLASKTGDSIME
jgi:hypothetical protein